MSGLLRLSESKGLKIISYAFPALALGATTIQYGLHTLLVEEYADFFGLYKNAIKVEVPEELENVLEKISDDLLIPVKKPVSKLTAVIGFDTTHFGSTLSKAGVFIGIPVSFFYKSKDDIDQSSIQIENKPIAWNSADGKKLEQSLILSDLAKQFGIAYELALADTPKLFLNFGVLPLTVFVYLQVNNYFCNVLGLLHRPFHIKAVFYLMLGIFGFGMYVSLYDISTQYCESKALDKVSEGGKDYIVGGIEFYDKLLTRNRALRNLFSDGKSDFNSYGDPIYFFRNKHIPITAKKSFLEQKSNELIQNDSS